MTRDTLILDKYKDDHGEYIKITDLDTGRWIRLEVSNFNNQYKKDIQNVLSYLIVHAEGRL